MAMRVCLLAAKYTKRPTALWERLDAHAAAPASRVESHEKCNGWAGMLPTINQIVPILFSLKQNCCG